MWEEAKSWCYCGHYGDGINSQHAGVNGHGACQVEGCDCGQFTWKSFRESYQQQVLDQAKRDYDESVTMTQTEAGWIHDLIQQAVVYVKCVCATPGQEIMIMMNKSPRGCLKCKLHQAQSLLRVAGLNL